MCAVEYMLCGMWVFCRGDRGERGSGFRPVCVGVKLGWDCYWFQVERGCDVFL